MLTELSSAARSDLQTSAAGHTISIAPSSPVGKQCGLIKEQTDPLPSCLHVCWVLVHLPNPTTPAGFGKQMTHNKLRPFKLMHLYRLLFFHWQKSQGDFYQLLLIRSRERKWPLPCCETGP